MATCYLTRFMVHRAPGKVRNTSTVIAPDITAFLGYCSDIHSRGRNEDGNIYTFTPSSSEELSGGLVCGYLERRRAGEQAPVASHVATLAGR